jgi:transcription elongation GreA/GreB family factor
MGGPGQASGEASGGCKGVPSLSRAFVKDDDPTGGAAVLSDRPISPHPNLVTQRGLRQIEEQVASFERELANPEAGPEAQGRAARELRYWSARLATARLEAPPAAPAEVRFGTAVTVLGGDGRQHRYMIVGEDEADPDTGRIAWTSPVARALLGAEEGDLRQLPRGEVEIVAVDAAAE